MGYFLINIRNEDEDGDGDGEGRGGGGGGGVKGIDYTEITHVITVLKLVTIDIKSV